jgi:type IV pilus assembly protein PilW
MNIERLPAAASAARMNRRTRHAGFSLVELMIGLALGLIILTALVTLFVDVSRSNQEMTKTNSQIENARFAMQILQDDIAHAGYWGGYVPEFDDLTFLGAPPTDVPAIIPAPCLDYASWTAPYGTALIGLPLQAYDAAPTGCTVVANRQANTDVLVVRHADTCELVWSGGAWTVPTGSNCEGEVAGKLYFQATRCELEAAASPFRLQTTNFTLHRRDCVGTGTPPALPIVSGTRAEKRRFISHIYYVRDFAVTAGDGIPTLVRSEFDLSGGTLAHQAAVPLIEGIQGFRVELGIDSLSETGDPVDYTAEIDWDDDENLVTPTNRGDGVPDGAFVHCSTAIECTVEQLRNVVAVRLYILARADRVTPGYTDNKTHNLGGQALGPFNDGFKRHVFSTSVRLMNVSTRRETP